MDLSQLHIPKMVHIIEQNLLLAIGTKYKQLCSYKPVFLVLFNLRYIPVCVVVIPIDLKNIFVYEPESWARHISNHYMQEVKLHCYSKGQRVHCCWEVYSYYFVRSEENGANIKYLM